MTFSIISPSIFSTTTTALKFAYHPFFILGTIQLRLVQATEQPAAQ